MGVIDDEDSFMRFAGKLQEWVISETRRKMLQLLAPETSIFALLDCGCGDGDFTMEVAGVFGASSTHGFDISLQNTIAARKRGVKVAVADFNQPLPYLDSTFDVVCASQVIELADSPERFLAEIYRVLKRRGLLVLSTPNLASAHNIVLLLLGRLPPLFRSANFSRKGPGSESIAAQKLKPSYSRKSFFTFGALRTLLDRSDFTILRVEGSGFHPVPAPFSRALARLARNWAVQIVIKAGKKERSLLTIRGGD